MLATESFNDYRSSEEGNKAELKGIYLALSRAVEEGDPLKIGIVLGQTLIKLEQIINGN